MAKRQRNVLVTTAFNYLVKSMPNEVDSNPPDETGFTQAEFDRLIHRLADTRPLDEADPNVITSIKAGRLIPLNYFEEIEPGLYFGEFDGAYYGQRYRNNRLGIVEAEDLNLRGFYYLITRTNDGKILIGTTYHGLYGDYDGLRNFISHLLRGNYKVASKTLKSVASELGGGQPVSLKLIYRRPADRPERRPLFGSSGVIAVNSSDFGDGFAERVAETARRLSGDVAQRKRVLAEIVSQDHLLTLDEDDIVGCSAVVRENGRHRTIYFLGDNSFSTKFPLGVLLDEHGLSNRETVRAEMISCMRRNIIPLLA